MRFTTLPFVATLALALLACHAPPHEAGPVRGPREPKPLGPVEVERITTAVPWPRGVQFVDGQLYALSRGVHRSAGGPQADIDDLAGHLFVVDPSISEPVDGDAPVGAAVRANGAVLAAPTTPPFRLWDRREPATLDATTDRPYCMLVYDAPSQNFFVCGYSGIDLPGDAKFRKNAADSVHRYDRRDGQWHVVEAHDPAVVPAHELQIDVDSRYYPHHDPEANEPPHGRLNGPCGAVVAGEFLYVGAKDNSSLAQYDLRAIRGDASAAPPPSRYVFEGSKGSAYVDVRGHGRMEVNGTCALTVHGGFLYVAFRTTSQILRFPLTESGAPVEPLVADYIAQFARYDPERGGGSANIYDMAFDASGRLYVSPGYDGAIYRFAPEPGRIYDATRPVEPYVDLEQEVGATKTGNICLDPAGNLYVCSGQSVLPTGNLRGVIYRVHPR